jgi:hypothetical protein
MLSTEKEPPPSQQNGIGWVDQFFCQLINAFSELRKMGLTIMSHSWEVKPFFAAAKVAAEREQRCSDLPYTGNSVFTHRKLLTTSVLHEASHATGPVCSCGGKIFRRLTVEGSWNVVQFDDQQGRFVEPSQAGASCQT